jgi:hypothetical protein
MDQQAMLYDDLKQLNNLYQAAMMSKLYDTADNIVDVYIPMGITACIHTYGHNRTVC